jgi:hypothetical protein
VNYQPRLLWIKSRQLSLTDLVELNGVIFGTHLSQESLGGATVRAVGLAEHGYPTVSMENHGKKAKSQLTNNIVVDNALRLGLCRRHSCLIGGRGSEEFA